MSRSHRLAWAAGFIDGDGFITVQDQERPVNGKAYRRQCIRVGCCQALEKPLKELQQLFGGSIRIKNCGPNRERYKRKTQYIWTISTCIAATALKEMLPFLVHKKEVALLALDLQETMGKLTNGKISEELMTYRLMIKDKIKGINSES